MEQVWRKIEVGAKRDRMRALIKAKDIGLNFLSGSVTRTTINTSAVLFVRLLIQTCNLLILAYALGASLFGTFTAVTSIAALFGILSLVGTNLLLLSEFARGEKNGQDALAYALPTFFFTSSFFFLIFIFLTMLFIDQREVSMSALLSVGLAEVVLFPLLQIIATYHQAHKQIAFSQVLTTIPLTARLTLALWILFLSPLAPLSSLFVGYTITAPLCLFIALRSKEIIFPKISSWRKPQPLELKKCVKYSFLNFFSLSFGEIDKVITYNLMLSNIAGIYAAGTRIIGAMTLPIGALIISALPKLFSDKNNPIFIKWIFITCILYSFSSGLIILLAASHLEKLFDASFSGLADCLSYLTVVIPMITLRITAGFILITYDLTSARLTYEAVGLGILIILNLLLIPPLGIIGAIVSLCISEAIMGITGWTIVFKLRK